MNNPAASMNQGSDDVGDIGGAAGGLASLFSAGSAHRHLISIVAFGP